MGYVILFVFIIIVIFAAVIMHADSSFKAHQEELKNLQESIPGFTVTKTISDLENKFILLIDDKSKKVCIVNGKNKTVVGYDKIMSVEYIENGNTISSKSAKRTIGGAIVGGMIAGGVGAIVGGLSGSSKSVNKISSIIIN